MKTDSTYQCPNLRKPSRRQERKIEIKRVRVCNEVNIFLWVQWSRYYINDGDHSDDGDDDHDNDGDDDDDDDDDKDGEVI